MSLSTFNTIGTMANIVITGASAGIGAEVARQLAAEGHSLVLAARRKQELQEVADACSTAGAPWVAARTTDVTERAQVDKLRDFALAQHGGVDVWINNAGRGISKPVLALTDDDVDEMMSINLKSALYGMQAIMPYFIGRDRGHLINVSSMLGRVPMAPFRSAYNAAKHALNALTANLRMDMLARGSSVFVSLVMPGIVITDFAENALGAGADARAHYALPGSQTVEEAARPIVELIASPRPEVLTNPMMNGLAEKYYADVAAWEQEWVRRMKPPVV